MYLEDSIQDQLRNLNYIKKDEVVQKQGDLFIAFNVVTQARRIINIDARLLETIQIQEAKNCKKILKG